MIIPLTLIMLAVFVVYTQIRSYQAWIRGKTVVSMLLLLLEVFGIMCLCLKLKELLLL